MKFAQIKQGTRHREPLELEIAGEKIAVEMRTLSVGERDTVITEARAAAKARKVDSPRDGDAIYDLQVKVRTLAIAIVDKDSPKEDPQPFFESAEQILSSPILGDDVIEYAFARWELHADQLGVYKKRITTAEIIRSIASLGSVDDSDPLAMARACSEYCEWSPAMQFHFAHYTARTLWNLQATKSLSTSPSTTEVSTPTPEPNPEEAADKTERGDVEVS